jgi:LuxR family maltose regulon positive regulatory protein
MYRQAARWFEANAFPYDAIEMALSGADFDHAATLILQAAETVIWAHGEWLLLERWLAALPESTVKSQARLCLYHAWGCLVRGQMATCNARLADADNVILRDQEANQLALGELASIRAAIARFQGNQPQVIAQAGIALSHLPPADNPWRVMTLLNLGAAHFLGDDREAATEALSEVWQLAQAEGQAMWGNVSASFLAQLLVRNGRYHDAAHLYQQALSLALPQQESIFNIGMLYVGLGELWLSWNDLDKAEGYLQQGLDIGTTAQNTILVWSGSLALARLRQIQGDVNAAKALVVRAQEVSQNSASTWSWVHVPMAAYVIRAWVKLGALPEARRLLESAVADAANQSDYWVESLKIAQARLLLAEERWQDAGSLLATLWEPAVAHQRIRSQIELLVLQAVTKQRLRQPDQARTHLQDALTLARPSGEVRLFLDEGRPIQELITTLHFADVARQTYRQTISDSYPEPQDVQLENANQQLVEPLTARELELLALVANGSTNREIAEQLVISYGTVRRHMNNIYGKLGVNSRALAILAAQDRDLV